MNCNRCASHLPDSATFCGKCGERFHEPVQAAEVMPNKTTRSAVRRKFCGKCGSELRANGACMRCVSVGSTATATQSVSAPVKIPWKPVSITAGLLVLVMAGFYGAKAWKGDTLLVRTNVPGAVIIVNGTERGRTSAERLAPLTIGHLHGGTYDVVARADGFEDGRREVIFPLRSPNPIALTLAPKPAGLRVQAVPGSIILLNGGIRGRADRSGAWMNQNLAPATLLIAVRHEGRTEWTQNVVLKPGETATLTADQPEIAPPPTVETAITPAPPDPPLQQVRPLSKAEPPPASRIVAQQLFGHARQAFSSRDYDGASNYCTEGLRLVPNDPAGTALCRRIEEIRHLTNQR